MVCRDLVFPPVYVGSVSWGFPCCLAVAHRAGPWGVGDECDGKGLVGGPCLGCDINIGFERSLL